MTQTEFNKIIQDMWDSIADSPIGEKFDNLCELVDDKFNQFGISAYVRIFWQEPCESTPSEMADELLDLGHRFNVYNYTVLDETNATVVVALLEYKGS